MQILPKPMIQSTIQLFCGKLRWLCLSLLFFAACNSPEAPVQFQRFDQDLFQTSTNPQQHFREMQDRYGDFYESFAEDMLNIDPSERQASYAPSLEQFVNHPSIKRLKYETDSVFKDLSPYEKDLGKAMGRFSKEFPEAKVPAFVTFISEFGYANVTLDTIVGIGLDMYLGSTYSLYPALEFPDFMVAKLRKEYLVSNAVKAMAIGKWESQLTDKRCLAMMLFEGKVRYFAKQLIPELPDTILFGYTSKQLKWAESNEAMIWKHFIDVKMLFNDQPNDYMRYFNDGPFTIATGVPQESAPAIGVYTGYRIISRLMEEKSMSLKELMQRNDWDQMLKESAYKPQ